MTGRLLLILPHRMRKEPYNLRPVYYDALGMRSEFESVIKCISNLGKELEQYGYLVASSYGRDSESLKKVDDNMKFIVQGITGIITNP